MWAQGQGWQWGAGWHVSWHWDVLGLGSISSSLSVYLKQHGGFKAISLVKNVETYNFRVIFMGFGKYVDTDICYVFGSLKSTMEMKVY